MTFRWNLLGKTIIFHSVLHREKLQYNVTDDIQNTHLLFKVEFLNITGENSNFSANEKNGEICDKHGEIFR